MKHQRFTPSGFKEIGSRKTHTIGNMLPELKTFKMNILNPDCNSLYPLWTLLIFSETYPLGIPSWIPTNKSSLIHRWQNITISQLPIGRSVSSIDTRVGCILDTLLYQQF